MLQGAGKLRDDGKLKYGRNSTPLFHFYRRVEELLKGGGEPKKMSDEDILELFESSGPTPMGEIWLKNYEKWNMRNGKAF